MSVSLCVRNRQRYRSVKVRLVRRLVQELVRRHFSGREVELGIHIVGSPEMSQVNEKFLRHAGSTDVITLGYSEPRDRQHCWGDIFVCVDEAVRQGRKYRVPWPVEMVRYIVHGLLHLKGYNDGTAKQRHLMKREENRVLRGLRAEFNLAELERPE